jgi:beta-xylosidase
MAADGKSLRSDFDKVVYQSRGSEANKLYKIDGIYYHFFSEVHAEGRVTMMNRSKSLEGPWETKQLNHVAKRSTRSRTRGGTRAGATGRVVVCDAPRDGLPVAWKEGWSVIGEPGSDGIGRMVWSAKKPVTRMKAVVPETNEEFDGKALGKQWEWNYAPRGEAVVDGAAGVSAVACVCAV